jgi:multiple sugar transport system substrate-binding protein
VRTVFAILISALLLAGCDRRQEKVVVAIGGAPAELAAWESLAADFHRETGIAVEILRQPADTSQQRQNLILALKAELANPDVVLMDVAWVGLFAASGWLEPLTGVDPSPFFEGVIAEVDTREGDLVALPVYMDGGLLYYRADLLERFGRGGPPATWPELLADCLAVQPALRESNPGFWGFIWQGAQYEGLVTSFLEFAGSEGGFVRVGGRIRLDLPANREALTFMRDLIWRYRVSPPSTYTEMKEEEVRLAFQQGDALFERNWPYAWRLHQQPGSPVAGKVGIAPPPAPAGGRAVSTLGGWHIAVSRFSDRKREALEFLRFVTSRQGQRRMVLALGWNPGRQDLYEEPEILERMPYLRELKEVFRHARSRPVLPYYTQVSEIAQRHLNGTLAGRDEPGEALQRAEAEIDNLLPRYRIE